MNDDAERWYLLAGCLDRVQDAADVLGGTISHEKSRLHETGGRVDYIDLIRSVFAAYQSLSVGMSHLEVMLKELSGRKLQ